MQMISHPHIWQHVLDVKFPLIPLCNLSAFGFSEYLKCQLTLSSPRYIPKETECGGNLFSPVWPCLHLSWLPPGWGTHAYSPRSSRRGRDASGRRDLAHLWGMGHFEEGGKDKDSLATKMRMSKAGPAGLVCLSRSLIVRIMRGRVWIKC